MWSTISAIGSLASAVAAAAAAIIALNIARKAREQSAFAIAVDLWWRMDERFDTPAMRSLRTRAARSILDHRLDSDEVQEMLDFFESIGRLERLKVIPINLIWHSMFEWVTSYWEATSGVVAEEQRKNPTNWADFGRLHQRLLEEEVRQNDGEAPRRTTADRQSFFASEARMDAN